MSKKVINKKYIRMDKFKYPSDVTDCECIECGVDMEMSQIQASRLTHGLHLGPDKYCELLVDYQTCGGCRV